MAAKSNVYSNDLLALVFNATTFANVAINATSSPITNIYVSLHTASPGASGNQTTSEATYGSYARVAVARTSSGWTVTSNSVSPVANIVFPTSTGTPSETETYVGIGSASSGAGVLFYYGPISPTITMNAAGITPTLTTASTITES
jgi:hypothetical protein